MNSAVVSPKPLVAPATSSVGAGEGVAEEPEAIAVEGGSEGQFFHMLVAVLDEGALVPRPPGKGTGGMPEEEASAAGMGGNLLPVIPGGTPLSLSPLTKQSVVGPMRSLPFQGVAPAPADVPEGGLLKAARIGMAEGDVWMQTGMFPVLPSSKGKEGVMPQQQMEPHLLQAMLVRAARETNLVGDAPSGVVASSLSPLATGTAGGPSTTLNPPPLPLVQPLHSPHWQNALGERMIWLVKRELQQAELRLNPQHLGPVEVRIEVRNDQANITFSAHHAITRDALEASIPRLREMLGDAGVALANVDISHRQHSGNSQQGERGREGPNGGRLADGEGEPGGDGLSLLSEVRRKGTGLIDLFA